MANPTIPDHQPFEKVVPLALVTTLKTAVPSLQQAYDEWPDPNFAIQMPCITVFASSEAKFSPMMPYKDLPPVNADGSPGGYFQATIPPNQIKNNQALVRYVIGEYDLNLQLDLWARNKEERDQMADQLFNALNPYVNPMGLDLTLANYFNQIANFLYIGHSIQDSAERSERGEWRVTYKILVTCKAIREKTEFIITQPATQQDIALVSDISTSVVVPES